jgi:hypothetical protein
MKYSKLMAVAAFAAPDVPAKIWDEDPEFLMDIVRKKAEQFRNRLPPTCGFQCHPSFIASAMTQSSEFGEFAGMENYETLNAVLNRVREKIIRLENDLAGSSPIRISLIKMSEKARGEGI